MNELIERLGKEAKAAARVLAVCSSEKKNKGLFSIADALETHADMIIKENELDIEKAVQKGTPKQMIDRLQLDQGRIKAMAEGVRQVAALPDPVGEVLSMWQRPNGLTIGQKRVPLGVIGIIYESRPNVTADAAALCLKSGNAVILRGGSDAICSNKIIAKVMRSALEQAGLPASCVALVEDTSRETATEMMKANGLIDVLIPRGGAGLISTVVQNATIPVIETGTGNCHVYVDESADVQTATDIIVNAKASRPSVCNAAETLLVHQAKAKEFLPKAYEALAKAGVTVRGCEKTCGIIPVVLATEEDYKTEFLDYILAVKVVEDIDEAIEHIATYSTR
ncbi:MAG: glutamate-5-semialdehyde dehydrogenase, partial [Ruminococcaceae bacterium]|nr:glutamate-5-semialdehyde dehydrogenase [Oscillospiraceae bacterium]